MRIQHRAAAGVGKGEREGQAASQPPAANVPVAYSCVILARSERPPAAAHCRHWNDDDDALMPPRPRRTTRSSPPSCVLRANPEIMDKLIMA